MCIIEQLLQLSDDCKQLSRAAENFTRRRQLDELSRRYRRLAEQTGRLNREGSNAIRKQVGLQEKARPVAKV